MDGLTRPQPNPVYEQPTAPLITTTIPEVPLTTPLQDDGARMVQASEKDPLTADDTTPNVPKQTVEPESKPGKAVETVLSGNPNRSQRYSPLAPAKGRRDGLYLKETEVIYSAGVRVRVDDVVHV